MLLARRLESFMLARLALCAAIFLPPLSANEGPGQAAGGQPERGGIVGKKAPPWSVESWTNLPKDKKRLNVDDFAGKVVYLYCFQSWCPGCHSSGFPTLKKVKESFKGRKDIVFVTMQTVFEGFDSNTKERGLATLAKFGLDVPLAMSGSRTKRSTIMQSYRTRGTPWTIIIGPDGKVVWNGFHIRPAQATALIETLVPKRVPPISGAEPSKG